MHIFITFGVRGEIEPKNVPEGKGRFRGLLKNDFSCQGTSLALLGYCYTIEGHNLNVHCQNW